MGVIYSVVPLDDKMREWLKSEGVALPRGTKAGQNPTPAEIRKVCSSLAGYRVKYSSEKKKFWQAAIEAMDGETGTLLNIDKFKGSEERRHAILFEKGSPSLILQIVHGLAPYCGPLVIIPDTGETPVAVWPEAKVDKLLRGWEHASGF